MGNDWFLIRHGAAEVQHLFMGTENVPLSTRGFEQAVEARKVIVAEGLSFDLAFCSPLSRAKDTLSIVLGQAQQSVYYPDGVISHPILVYSPLKGASSVRIQEDTRLLDFDYGDLSLINHEAFLNAPYESNYESNPFLTQDGKAKHSASHPNPTSIDDILQAAASFFRDIEDRFEGKKIVVAAHGSTIYALSTIGSHRNSETVYQEMRKIPHATFLQYRSDDYKMMPANQV